MVENCSVCVCELVSTIYYLVIVHMYIFHIKYIQECVIHTLSVHTLLDWLTLTLELLRLLGHGYELRHLGLAPLTTA